MLCRTETVLMSRDDRHVSSWWPSRSWVTTVTYVRDDHHVVLWRPSRVTTVTFVRDNCHVCPRQLSRSSATTVTLFRDSCHIETWISNGLAIVLCSKLWRVIENYRWLIIESTIFYLPLQNNNIYQTYYNHKNFSNMNLKSLLFSLLLLPVGQTALAQRSVKSLNEGWKFAFGSASSMEKDFTHGTEYFTYLAKAGTANHDRSPADRKSVV